MSRFEALLDAARKRARPIVMTSIAMGAGMLPIAVIGGLICSTVLSLVYVPVVYTFMDDIQRFLGWLLVDRSDADSQAPTATPAKDHSGHVYPA